MSTGEDVSSDDFRFDPIPEGRQHYAGETYGYEAGLVIAAAAAPFLQALFAYFGNRLAGAIDGATRSLARRFVLRLFGRSEEPRSRAHVWLRMDSGWVLQVATDLEAEGLGQLVELLKAPGPSFDQNSDPLLAWGG
ncbi:hypothetical protein [Streptomyces mirabilis]|uniref:hypothetical protein n=1 Tax=Streptomyces mirabilis TaxID=68239 RepID=UPI003331B083